MLNILISSAGKRVELLKEFQSELKSHYPSAKVIAVDLNPVMAPACHVADVAFKVPRVTTEEYVPQLIRICTDNDVKVVVPTIDTELAILAENKDFFQENGVEVLVPDSDFVALCRDKRKTNGLFQSLGIKYPKPIDKNNPVFPLFAKPYDGSLSVNLHIITGPSELTPELLDDSKLMFMELIDKSEYKEYTVDMYYDRDNKVKSIVPRERLEIRSGEINKGISRKNYIVDFLKDKMGYMPGVRGCICMQLFYRESDRDVIAIEINPRFGGGYPLSYYSGANFPQMVIREYLNGEGLDYSDDWKDGTIMLRYDSQVILPGE